jgi:hypothetical protein
MAKNVQIVPLSGSVEFQDTTEDNIKYTYNAGKVTISVGGVDVMSYESGSTNSVNISNTSRFAIPVRTSTETDPEGTLSFDTASNSLDVVDDAGQPISLQGPQGPQGAIGAIGVIGPRGTATGDQGSRFSRSSW